MAELYGTERNGTCKTSAEISKTFTASENYTIPTGYTKMDLFAVGGGASGNSGRGGGGGSGYTKTVKSITVSSGQTIAVTIGAGGARVVNGTNYEKKRNAGSASKVVRSGATLVEAAGGILMTKPGATYSDIYDGGAGGSGGGGAGVYVTASNKYNGYPGGSDGANGKALSDSSAGVGQGTTTRAWGASNGTLYAGGGGGSGGKYTYGGVGGTGGGGAGGRGGYYEDKSDFRYYYSGSPGVAGTANTGGGGGGGGERIDSSSNSKHGDGGAGGTGIVLMKLY